MGMLAKPNNTGRVWERAEVVFLPEKLFSNSITHFPLEKKNYHPTPQ